jgi:FlaA1/EpsC-like NDP-sugar epimerase
VLIVGAGDGGRLVLREVLRNPQLGLSPLGFVDDDPRLRGVRVEGVKVLGDTDGDLPRILDEVEPEEVLIAIPSAPAPCARASRTRVATAACRSARCPRCSSCSHRRRAGASGA